MYHYLKTETEEQMRDALIAAGILSRASDDSLQQIDPVSMIIVGAIYKPTGNKVSHGGYEVDEQLPIPGFHVNLCGDLTPEQLALLPVIPTPANPSMGWA